VLWRGGRNRREPTNARSHRSRQNGVRRKDIEVTFYNLGDEEEIPQDTKSGEDYEKEEEERDRSYPGIIQQLQIPWESPVLHVAVPSITTAAATRLSTYARDHVFLAISCSDTTSYILAFPLRPPTLADKQNGQVPVRVLPLAGDGSMVRSLAVKLLSGRNLHELPMDDTVMDDEEQPAHHLIVAAAGADVTISRVAISNYGFQHAPVPKTLTVEQPLRLAFTPQSTSSNLLISDRSGAVRIYESLVRFSMGAEAATDLDLTSPDVAGSSAGGRWLTCYQTPFHSSHIAPRLARRKGILAASWVLSGRGILVLLDDGQWGVWDFGSTSLDANTQGFALHGYLDSPTDTAESSTQKKQIPKLSPMTPNTRKSKSDNLFSNPTKKTAPTLPPSGGISVSAAENHSGSLDESVVLYYNEEIYSIPSMQALTQRSSSNSSGTFGSLYAPGLTQISDLNLMNELISSVSQLGSQYINTGLGQMNLQGDLVISTQHRIIVLQRQQSTMAKRGLFQRVAERPKSRDQHMLDAGELDLDGMDRMLDGMAGTQRSVKVGFAS
jgi:hypothetical protein